MSDPRVRRLGRRSPLVRFTSGVPRIRPDPTCHSRPTRRARATRTDSGTRGNSRSAAYARQRGHPVREFGILRPPVRGQLEEVPVAMDGSRAHRRPGCHILRVRVSASALLLVVGVPVLAGCPGGGGNPTPSSPAASPQPRSPEPSWSGTIVPLPIYPSETGARHIAPTRPQWSATDADPSHHPSGPRHGRRPPNHTPDRQTHWYGAEDGR